MTFFGAEVGPSESDSLYSGLHGILLSDRDAIHVMKLQYEPGAGGKSNSHAYDGINSSLKINSITLVCRLLRDLQCIHSPNAEACFTFLFSSFHCWNSPATHETSSSCLIRQLWCEDISTPPAPFHHSRFLTCPGPLTSLLIKYLTVLIISPLSAQLLLQASNI